ncbi:MAG: hypothetical protein LUI02_06280 [Clostridiales bacterium]|nr:hypothetical protein [Clostridiales bacterium]
MDLRLNVAPEERQPETSLYWVFWKHIFNDAPSPHEPVGIGGAYAKIYRNLWKMGYGDPVPGDLFAAEDVTQNTGWSFGPPKTGECDIRVPDGHDKISPSCASADWALVLKVPGEINREGAADLLRDWARLASMKVNPREVQKHGREELAELTGEWFNDFAYDETIYLVPAHILCCAPDAAKALERDSRRMCRN